MRKDGRYVVWIKTEAGPFYVLGKPDDGFVVLRSFGNEDVANAYAKNCPDGWGAFVTRRECDGTGTRNQRGFRPD